MPTLDVEHRRALSMLAEHANGCTEAILLVALQRHGGPLGHSIVLPL